MDKLIIYVVRTLEELNYLKSILKGDINLSLRGPGEPPLCIRTKNDVFLNFGGLDVYTTRDHHEQYNKYTIIETSSILGNDLLSSVLED